MGDGWCLIADLKLIRFNWFERMTPATATSTAADDDDDV